jgi:hypothetical protein
MGLIHTYTFVRYCSDESPVIPELAEAYRKLAEDLEHRRPHISKQAASAMERRIELVRHAWALLLEPVPASFE